MPSIRLKPIVERYTGQRRTGGARMIDPTVTLTLPTRVYQNLQRRAQQHQRPLEDEATLTLAAAVATEDALPDDLSAALDALATLDDETLERVSHSQPTVEDGILLDALVDTRRRRPLTPGEEQMLVALVERHDRAMALRAEAVALLHAAGHRRGRSRRPRMSVTWVGQRLRAQVLADAGGWCGYCRSSEEIMGASLEIEHVVPEVLGGPTRRDNLWAACRQCNAFKGDRIRASDPATGEEAPLFDPRRQSWEDHVAWGEDGARIVGWTPTGRATVDALGLNRPLLVRARQRWVAAGWHPPAESET